MSSPELTRRGALSLVLAGLVASGCDLDTSGTPPTDTDPGASPATSGGDTEDPDAVLVERVRGDLGQVLALVTAAGRTRPALGDELAAFRRLHRRHLAALPGDSAEPPTPEVGGDADRVRAAVRRQELRLQRRLADAAVESESGPLAALLGSMSAAVAQQLAATEVSR